MNTLRRHLRTLLIVALSTGLPVAQASAGEMWSLSISSLALVPEERIVGFEVNVTAGGIASLRFVPMGWSITIENDPSWNTRITGSALVGAAALNPNHFRGFVVIEKHEFMDLRFAVEAVFIVTQDFKTERRIRVQMKDLVLQRR